MISVHNLKKSFGNVQVLKGINIEIRKGECVCIIGPSGSGKSTFLRCLNLLEVPDEGEIIIEGESILEKRKDIDKYRENVGMVFQHFNLFPNSILCDSYASSVFFLEEGRDRAADRRKGRTIPAPGSPDLRFRGRGRFGKIRRWPDRRPGSRGGLGRRRSRTRWPRG